jgi:hypothetical protein
LLRTATVRMTVNFNKLTGTVLVSYPRSGNSTLRTPRTNNRRRHGLDTRPDRALSKELAEMPTWSAKSDWDSKPCVKSHWPERTGNTAQLTAKRTILSVERSMRIDSRTHKHDKTHTHTAGPMPSTNDFTTSLKLW